MKQNNQPKTKLRRPDVPKTRTDGAVTHVRQEFNTALKVNGRSTLASRHEIRGVIDEAHDGLVEAVNTDDREALKTALTTLAVLSIFALACVEAETISW